MAGLRTQMRAEIEEIPAAVARLLDVGRDQLAAAGARLRQADPVMIATIARGSSDHAAAYLKYAIELVAGVPVASVGPSITSIFGRELRLKGCAALAISQSGKSPDIVAMTQSARSASALTLALTNTPGSPLATAAEIAIDLAAGEERSVAATKSFVSSVVAGLMVLAQWQSEVPLEAGLQRLPGALERALAIDWWRFAGALEGAGSLFVLGRGPTFAIAQEAALKFKETCGLHAEAYSAAEVLHGPARIVGAGFPVLALAAHDTADAAIAEVADRLAAQGARTYVTSSLVTRAETLPSVTAGHPIVDALPLIVSFYAFVERLSRQRGLDPDHPPHLSKVTETT
jgi:glucosamine--fructose-6-phosphate aminotransferase (isomerizing)